MKVLLSPTRKGLRDKRSRRKSSDDENLRGWACWKKNCHKRRPAGVFLLTRLGEKRSNVRAKLLVRKVRDSSPKSKRE